MTTLDAVLDGVAAAMAAAVPSLSTVLSREADAVDNEVQYPFGDITVVSNPRSTAWNTDFVGYATDATGTRTGDLYDALFDCSLQCNVWLAVPSDTHDIATLGATLERGLRPHDSQQQGQPLPDGRGGTLDDVDTVTISGGGELPTQGEQRPPVRGYRVDLSVSYKDRIDTSSDSSRAIVETIDTPQAGDMSGGDAVAIEYVPADFAGDTPQS